MRHQLKQILHHGKDLHSIKNLRMNCLACNQVSSTGFCSPGMRRELNTLNTKGLFLLLETFGFVGLTIAALADMERSLVVIANEM